MSATVVPFRLPKVKGREPQTAEPGKPRYSPFVEAMMDSVGMCPGRPTLDQKLAAIRTVRPKLADAIAALVDDMHVRTQGSRT